MSQKEDSTKINYIAKQVDELRERIARIFDILSNHQERLDKLVNSLPFLLALMGGGRVDETEIEEVTRLARQKGITPAQMIEELEKKGTLPPSIRKFRKALRTIKEWLG